MAEIPYIKPIKTKQYECKQSKYGDSVPQLPFRSCILGPSGSGKTILLQNMILDIYKGCFEKIYVFSPSIFIDDAWLQVKKYIEKECNQSDDDKEPPYYDHYDAEALSKIMEMQKKITKYQKDNDQKKLFNILVILDDLADSKTAMKNNQLLNSLYVRGRHVNCSVIVSTQVYKALDTVIRKNFTHIFVYRLRNYSDLEGLVDELSALTDKKTIIEIYKMATTEPYSFLYINLMAKKLNDIFRIRFDKKIEIN